MPVQKPTRTADLDYFYGQSGELFSFYRIPKALFRDRRFQQLSTDAKTLYGILLDRMSLSAKNNWLDSQGRVFIYQASLDKRKTPLHIGKTFLTVRYCFSAFRSRLNRVG